MRIVSRVRMVFGGYELPAGSVLELPDDEAAGLIARDFASAAPEMIEINAEPNGTLSPEITGDGTGAALPEIDQPRSGRHKRGRA